MRLICKYKQKTMYKLGIGIQQTINYKVDT